MCRRNNDVELSIQQTAASWTVSGVQESLLVISPRCSTACKYMYVYTHGDAAGTDQLDKASARLYYTGLLVKALCVGGLKHGCGLS